MTTVLLRKEAEDDLQDAARWYESQRVGLGNEFLTQALRMFDRIGDTPLAFPEVYRGLRRALLRRFPFAVYFRVEAELVSVVAVMYSSRSPTAWKGRS